MGFDRGLYVKLRNGQIGMVVGDAQVRTADGSVIRFNPEDVDGLAEWDDITRFRQAAFPSSATKPATPSTASSSEWLLEKYRGLIDKFLEIAERKVSRRDEYGDEQMHLLGYEADVLTAKIAGREGLDEAAIRRKLKNGDISSLPEQFRMLREALPKLFSEHHARAKSQRVGNDDMHVLSGIDFETYVGNILRESGFDVCGTPATGDQGADLIAIKGERRIVIQVKRYSGKVSNKAVQEVVAALKFYNGTQAVVVTNSTFTPSARHLARINDVLLIEATQHGRLKSL